ncbi:MAG: nucleoside hydrolase [Synechococcales cyanobacterium]
MALIIDCDPGVDDAVALLLALASPELTLDCVTTVAGNVPLSWTSHNARQVCELAGCRDLPIYAGCPRPLLQPLLTAPDIHGETGLRGAILPEPTLSLQSTHGVVALIERLIKTESPVTLATLGPLTNVATALIMAPDIARRIERIVMMGGAMGLGNVTPSAEFNCYVDPHAAAVVFESGIPITMIGLDVTHQVLTTPERLAQIRALDSPVSMAVAGWLGFYGWSEATQKGWAGPPLHDPCVIAYLLRPELFGAEPCVVQVSLTDPLTLGRTVVDRFGVTDTPTNAEVVLTVDSDGFYDLLLERLARYGS